ncbi:MAG TPA: hypothetical protein PKK48_07850, partial [Phycisphaerae bacterium]|nr:hypothetical protein [Phycisphaerae bacterium]
KKRRRLGYDEYEYQEYGEYARTGKRKQQKSADSFIKKTGHILASGQLQRPIEIADVYGSVDF